jgi:hypothetical protein
LKDKTLSVLERNRKGYLYDFGHKEKGRLSYIWFNNTDTKKSTDKI